jgi:hypothetical protein
MPQISWTTDLHPDHLVRLQDLMASSFGLHLDQRQSDNHEQRWRQDLPRRRQHEAIEVMLRWRDSRNYHCRITVHSQEQDHPESTQCWDYAIRLRRLLPPVEQ